MSEWTGSDKRTRSTPNTVRAASDNSSSLDIEQSDYHDVVANADEMSSISGLLRLPTELRLQIYDILLADKYDICYTLPFKNKISLSPRLYALPLPRICRQLRYDTIPFIYGKLWWEVDEPGPAQIKWLQTMDPFAIQCMKGLRIKGFHHYCANSDCRSMCCLAWIVVPFDGDSIKVTTEHPWINCAVGRKRMGQRVGIIEHFARKIERDRSRTKETVQAMLLFLKEFYRRENMRIER